MLESQRRGSFKCRCSKRVLNGLFGRRIGSWPGCSCRSSVILLHWSAFPTRLFLVVLATGLCTSQLLLLTSAPFLTLITPCFSLVSLVLDTGILTNNEGRLSAGASGGPVLVSGWLFSLCVQLPPYCGTLMLLPRPFFLHPCSVMYIALVLC